MSKMTPPLYQFLHLRGEYGYGKYYILDSHFERINSSLDSEYKTNFVKFKEYLNSEDKELCNKLKRDCEMVLLNNR